MKKIIVIGILSVLLFGSAFAGINNVNISSEDRPIVIERCFEFPKPEINSDGKYATIAMNDAGYLMQEGAPILPYKVEIMRFPIGSKIKVEAKEGDIEKMEMNKKIKPYPLFTLLTTKGELKIAEGKIYNEGKIYPEKWVESKISVGLYNGERVLTLSVFMYPYRYDVYNNTILYTDRINLKVSYEPSPTIFTADEYDLLIVCPNKYKYGRAWYNELLPLVEHKEGHGIRTKLVSLDQAISGTYFPVQGRDDAEKLKYFIKEAIEQWGIKYVMLVGGRQGGVLNERWLMPVRYTHLDDGSGWEASYLSDLYFADVYKYEDGKLVFEDWDSNGNGKFAEWKGMKKDELDLAPDVAIGRLACRNIMEVKIMVKKIIEYENSNALNEPWFKKMVVVGGDTFPPEDDPYYEGEVSTAKSLEYMEGFEPVKLWTSLGTLTGEEDVVNAVSQGCGFLNFEGHGNPMSWATHPPNDEETWIGGLIVSDIPKLSNKNMYPVCVVGGCHNSQFNVSVFNLLKLEKFYETYYKSEWSPECWSWWLARKIDGGSIATIGCTGLGYGYIGDYNNDGIPDCVQGLGGWIDIEFFRIYGQEKIDVLGDIHSTAITNYVSNFPVMKDNIDCKTVQEWVLLGDPSLKIGGYS